MHTHTNNDEKKVAIEFMRPFRAASFKTPSVHSFFKVQMDTFAPVPGEEW